VCGGSSTRSRSPDLTFLVALVMAGAVAAMNGYKTDQGKGIGDAVIGKIKDAVDKGAVLRRLVVRRMGGRACSRVVAGPRRRGSLRLTWKAGVTPALVPEWRLAHQMERRPRSCSWRVAGRSASLSWVSSRGALRRRRGGPSANACARVSRRGSPRAAGSSGRWGSTVRSRWRRRRRRCRRRSPCRSRRRASRPLEGGG